MKSKRVARLLLLVLATAVVVVAIPMLRPVFWWVVTTKESFGFVNGSFDDTWGWYRKLRWSEARYGYCVLYYTKNGFKARESDMRHGKIIWATDWLPNGEVSCQIQLSSGGMEEEKLSPPWWRDVEDQTSPSDPQWIAEHGK